MTNSNQILWSKTALLVAAMLAIGMCMPINAAYADTTNSLANEQAKMKVRMEEEHKLMKKDSTYKKHNLAMAQHYADSAKLVERQGGDPKPLLDAADYFAKQAE